MGLSLPATTQATLSADSKPPAPLTREQATTTLEEQTKIAMCADADPAVFMHVQIGTPIRYKPVYGAVETDWLYPVLVDYAVHCTQGNRNMRYGEVEEWHVEVHGDFRLYKDHYGNLQVANAFDSDYYGDNQYWNNAQASVRCRAKRLAYLTYDTSGNVIKRRDNDTPGYGDCAVRLRVPAK
jgi:hypothetical protein